MASPTRWGFMGCGNMANDFASAMKLLPKTEHEIIAVGARDLKRAKEFADKFLAKQAFEGYESVANCPDVDIVYVNVINTLHYHCVKLALNAGKSVLCETPMGMNAGQVREMIQLARQKNLFLMEAFWSRCFPVYEEIRQALKDGRIGEPKFLQAMFGFDSGESADSPYPHFFKKELGNSSIMGIGCYTIMLTTMIFNGQRPESIHATGTLNTEGIDVTDIVTLRYKDNGFVQLTVSGVMSTSKEQRAIVIGTKGTLELPELLYCPTKVIINSKQIEFPLPDAKEKSQGMYPNYEGLSYELQHVRECLLKGLKESPLMTLEHTDIIVSVVEEVRHQIGCIYPDSL